MFKRNKKVKKYFEMLESINGVRIAQNSDSKNSANHILVVRIDFTQLKISRASLMNSLRLKGVGTQVHYIPIPLQPYYESLGYSFSNIPEAIAYYQECLTLPLFPDLKVSELKKVVGEITKLLKP
jgi:dTDP-4-amino-4,6-dideoxygalactose transaminase